MNLDLVSLRVAADENDLKKFKSILKNANHDALRGKTASEIAERAASHGNLDIIQYLAEMKPAVLDEHALFVSARMAAERGHLNVVRYLVEKEPSVMTEDDRDSCEGETDTLAEVAARNQHLDILLYLAKKEAAALVAKRLTVDVGPDANALKLAIRENILDEKTLETLSSVSSDKPALICEVAATQGNLNVVRYFVERDPSVLTNNTNTYHRSIANAAAYHAQWNVFWYVVEKDPSLLMRKNWLGTFPLLQAVEHSAVTAAKLRQLVQENKVQLGGTNKYGESIVHMAAKVGNLDIIIYIDETEPSILQKQTELAGVAAGEGNWEIVRYLAVKNPSVYTQVLGSSDHNTEQGFSIFYKAVRENRMNQRTLKYLLETRTVHLNLRESHEDGNLAQLSIKNENPDLFNYLVRREPSLLSDKIRGLGTVGHVAGQRRYLTEEIISTVVEKTPSLFMQKDDIKGNTFLHLAMEQNLMDVKTLEKLFDEKFVTLTEVNNEGDTLAHTAAASVKPNSYKEYVLEYALKRAAVDSVKNCQIIAFIAKKQASILAWRNSYGDTIALVAARKGHIFVLEEIARIFPSILLKTDRQENSVLHLMAAVNRTRLITLSNFEMLVGRGVPLKGTNRQGDTTAHIAARNGFVELVEFVIRKEPTVVGVKNAAGRNIALTAAENAHYNVIRCIPDKELLLDRDNSGNTIFHLILQSGTFNPSEFTHTFENVTIPADLLVEPNGEGLSAVYLANRVGCSDLIKLIAKEKPSALVEQTHSSPRGQVYNQLEVIKNKILSSNEKCKVQGIHTLFQFYNENDVLNIVRDIEKKMTNISERDRGHFDEIAIRYAIESGYFTILKHFIENRKVDVNQPNAEGEPPIFIAVRSKHDDMLKYLAERPGVNLGLTDRRGNNVLFVALEKDDDLSTVKYVLDEKKAPINVNWRNKAGDTILHMAVRNAIKEGRDYYSETMQYLIQQKHANTNVRGLRNRTAIMYAAKHKRFDICNYLLDHGANPHFKDETGKNFWDVSRFHVKKRRSVEAVPVSMFHNSQELRIDEHVPRVGDPTQADSGAIFADHYNAPLSLFGFTALAQALLRSGRQDRRQYNYPSSNSSAVEVVYAKMDPIALEASLGNRWD